MKTWIKYYAIFLIGSAVFLTACDKAEEDNSKPNIIVQTPEAYAIYDSEDTIFIAVTIEDNDGLHNLTAKITNQSTNEVVFQEEKHEHGESVNYTASFVPTVIENTDFLFEFSAEDHNGNNKDYSATFHVHN